MWKLSAREQARSLLMRACISASTPSPLPPQRSDYEVIRAESYHQELDPGPDVDPQYIRVMALTEKRTYRSRNYDRNRCAAGPPQALPLPDNHVQLFTSQQNLQPTAGSDGGKAVLSENRTHASFTSRKNLQSESAGDEDEGVLPENLTRQPLNFQQDLQPQAEYDEGRAVMNNSVGLSEVIEYNYTGIQATTCYILDKR